MNKTFLVITCGANSKEEKFDTLEEAFECYLGKSPEGDEYHELWVSIEGSDECNVTLKLDCNNDW